MTKDLRNNFASLKALIYQSALEMVTLTIVFKKELKRKKLKMFAPFANKSAKRLQENTNVQRMVKLHVVLNAINKQ